MYQKTTEENGGEKACHRGRPDELESNQHSRCKFERIQYCKLEAGHTSDKDS